MEITATIPPSEISTVEAQRIQGYARAAKADSTKRAYVSDMKRFAEWCANHELVAMPAAPETVIRFIVEMAESRKVTTLERYPASINTSHRARGFARPARLGEYPLKDVWDGIVRTKGRKKEKKEPLLIEDIRHIASCMPDDIKGARDKAIILWGFATASRRSELCAADVAHVGFTIEGAGFFVPKSKRDQERRGLTKGVLFGENPLTCPVKALKRWIDLAGITAGPLFRRIDKHGNALAKRLGGGSVNQIVKDACLRAGLNPDPYGAHSLRAGFCTQAARSGIPEYILMRHTGHKSVATVREYIIAGELFTESPTGSLGL